MASALAIVRFCRTVPHTLAGEVFRRQLLKAGTSVGANYRASCRGRTTREKLAKLGIALEEADESDYWLSILATFTSGNAEQREWLLKEAGELIRIFFSKPRDPSVAKRQIARQSTQAAINLVAIAADNRP